MEWPTLALAVAVHTAWGVGLWLIAQGHLTVAFGVLAVVLAQHSSLQHEILHGHPFASRFASELLARLPVGLAVPYGRFRDTHLAHHQDARLTDPYDDPESNFLDPGDWEALPAPLKALFRFNNTLFGRMLVGPAISCVRMIRGDAAAILKGDGQIARDWAEHIALSAGIVALVAHLGGRAGVLAYLAAAYVAFSLLKIRTYLEHRAADRAPERSVIVESRGPLAWLFLNNNYHALHHARPGLPWYELPRAYARERAQILARNGGYLYRSYAEIFARYLLRPKDPVPHPLWRRNRGPRMDR